MPLVLWVLGGVGAGSLIGISASKGITKVLFVAIIIASWIWFKGGQ
ncbi:MULTISPECIES: hypothetical protein [Vibrio]|nr:MULTISPECIES: hypothetical protein [Vibrio]TCO04498.1 hypothetical protein EDB30_10344 [Vibrio crassostreae]CAK1917102.1 Membrane transporter protein [Vibrio crassostreae]CAK1978230.1 Membrane transporter protein [Vibrio crassostreae]CAK2023309.1 Membrane transporter protein [Vibrio crassostreae]CAK2026782.1 Membrane transporter protein [Vibrio crassostreae]